MEANRDANTTFFRDRASLSSLPQIFPFLYPNAFRGSDRAALVLKASVTVPTPSKGDAAQLFR